MRKNYGYKNTIHFAVGAALLLASLSPAIADDSSSTRGSKKDKAFIKEAMEGNQKEVAMAQLGASKAQNQELKELCAHIQKDHSAANQKLQTIAQTHNVTVDQSSKKHEKETEKFQEMSGAEFEKEFALAMLEDHQKDIEKYQKASKNVEASDLQAYISETLPKLQQHFQHAQTAAAAVGVDQNKIAAIAKKVQDSSMGGSGDDTNRVHGSGSSSHNY